MSNQSVIPGDIDALSRQFDEGRHLRLGGWLVLLGFGGFLLWGLLAPLDKGVPVSGSVVVAGNRKAVQHPSGGVVSQIQVHEGDRVRAGQVLLLMDTVDSRTQRDALPARNCWRPDCGCLPAGAVRPGGHFLVFSRWKTP